MQNATTQATLLSRRTLPAFCALESGRRVEAMSALFLTLAAARASRNKFKSHMSLNDVEESKNL